MADKICELPVWTCASCNLPYEGRRRRGPLGPQTLCNRCGLRFYRKNRAANSQKLKEENMLVTAVANEYLDRLTAEQQRLFEWRTYQQHQWFSWMMAQQMRAYQQAEMERLMSVSLVPLNIESITPSN